MLRAKRPFLASILAFSLLFAGWAPMAHAFDPDSDRPGEISMMADALLARPVLLVSTVIGLGLFTVTLPFSLLGDNVDEAAEALVKAPARATFLRCLGCTPAQHEQRQNERSTERANR
ncbi:MAG: hypothetical protein ACK4SX_09065 [Alcanivoracaceae bacterium]